MSRGHELIEKHRLWISKQAHDRLNRLAQAGLIVGAQVKVAAFNC